jgi:hypothetical protein
MSDESAQGHGNSHGSSRQADPFEPYTPGCPGRNLRYRNFQVLGDVKPGTVENQDGVSAVGNFSANDIEGNRNRPSVKKGQHYAHSLSSLRTRRAKDIRPNPTLISWRGRTTPALCPDPRQCALLPNPRFVLHPNLDRLASRMLRQRCGYVGCEVFLKTSCAAGSILGLNGRTESEIAQCVEKLSNRPFV